MIGISCRKWRPVVGVLAVGMLAFGLSLQGAPAGDDSAGGAADRGHMKPSTTGDSVAKVVMPGVDAPAPSIRLSAGKGGVGLSSRIIAPYAVAMTALTPVPRQVSRGAAEVGAVCTCDDDCSGLDAEFGCVQGQCIDGECDVRDAPSLSICEDGVNDCTIGRCDAGQFEIHGDAVCNDYAAVDPGADPAALSRCAKECIGGSNAGHNCTRQESCAGGDGCTLKTHSSPDNPGWQVTCTDTTPGDGIYDCSMTHGADDVVRCCETTDPANVGYMSSAACTGFGGTALTVTDPDNTMHVTSGAISDPRCPQYSSGIAPEGTYGTAIGPITSPPLMCNNAGQLGTTGFPDYGAPCEDAADCHKRCVSGTDLGGICQFHSDCAGAASACQPDTCVANAAECGDGFWELGDDYSFDTNKWIRFQEIRFHGGTGRGDEIMAFDIYDETPVRVTTFWVRFGEEGIGTWTVNRDCDEGCDFWANLCDITDIRCEIPAEPPRVIPPKGWVVMRPSRFVNDNEDGVVVYNEFDLNGWWSPTTNPADVGGNDGDRIWVNGAILEAGDSLPGIPAAGDRTLAFELVGAELDEPPSGGCCLPGGGCADTFEHLCRFCAGTGSHVGDVCDRSNRLLRHEGTWQQIDRDCPELLEGCGSSLWHGNRSTGDFIEGAAEDCATACSTASCCDTDGTCTTVTTSAECTDGGGTPLAFGTSCSDDAAEAPDPWEPNCCPHPGYDDGGGLRDPGGQCCGDLYRCSITGEFCNPLDSHSCDAPKDGLCELSCSGAMVLELAVPPLIPLGQRTVLDIVTDSTGVVDNPDDDCAYGEDPGWYVSWHLTECAHVTLNTCCNEPRYRPAGYQSPSEVCPCKAGQGGDLIPPNPNRSGYGAAARNNFICEDGNFSVEWTLGPGTYNWSPDAGKHCEGSLNDCKTESDCAPGEACFDNRGSHHVHIIAEPCLPAACCVIDESDASDIDAMCLTTTCHELNVWECGELGGDFLGDIEIPVPACLGQPGACGAGACCVLGGECDDKSGDKMTCIECKTLGQTFPYHGGLTCAEAPCAICPFRDAAHGQLDTGDFMFSADLQLGIRVADDFIPAEAGVVNRICYSHGYAPPGSGECADVPADDDLEVRFYDDNFGMPGTELIDSPGTDVAWDARGNVPGFRIWEYSAPITGVQLEADTCYWISIQGHGRSDCILNWIESRDGNNYRVVDSDGTWDAGDFRKSDYVFFLDIGIVPAITPRTDGGCGNIPVACCTTDGGCTDMPIADCLLGNGIFFPTSIDPLAPVHSCADITCPIPVGDDCADAVPMCVNTCQNTTDCALSTRVECETQADCDVASGGSDTCLPWAPCYDNGICGNADTLDEGPICSRLNRDCYDGSPCRPAPEGTEVYRCELEVDTRLATTDGPGPGGSCAGWIQADIWKKVTAVCTGTMVLDECNSLSKYDGMLEIFGDDTAGFPDTGCPVDDDDNSNLILCNDDFCPGSATVEGFETPVVEGAEYLLRWGGWSSTDTAADADQGIVIANVGFVCPPAPDSFPPGLPPDPLHHGPKNRYLSMDLTTNAPNSVAYRVTLSEMNRCSGDTRRACTDTDVCPNICTGNSDLQCTNDGQCGGAGPCIPSGPCVAHSDVGLVWYIDTPFEKTAVPNDDMVGEYMANLVAAPVFREWPEDTVHVSACEVVPAAVYDVVAVDQISGDPSVDALTIGTIVKPLGTHYGDVVGIVTGGVFTPPQGVVSVTDVSAYLIGNQGGAPGTAPPHTTWIDLHGTQWPEACTGDTCTIPQAILSVSDLGRIKFGFLGVPYNVTPGQEDPGNCPQ